jgi:hypothetical protein
LDEFPDEVNRSKLIEIQIVQRNANTEFLLEMRNQLDEGQRIDRAAIDEVTIRRWRRDVQMLKEDVADPLV